jgi:single-strand DNA-binding protein
VNKTQRGGGGGGFGGGQQGGWGSNAPSYDEPPF